MKPGYLTTEFWTSAGSTVATLITAAVAIGWLSPSDGQTLNGAIGGGITAAAAFIANAYVIVQYVSHRTALKADQGQK